MIITDAVQRWAGKPFHWLALPSSSEPLWVIPKTQI